MKKSIGNSRPPIGLAGIAYQLPECIKPLDQLESEGRISSPASLLRGFGFENCRIQEDRQEGSDLLLRSTKQAIREKRPVGGNISRVFLYSGINPSQAEDAQNVLELFNYPVAELRHKLDLPRASAIALSQQGCSGILSAIDMARRLLSSPEVPAGESILCAAADYLPAWANREIMYNIISDATAAVVVSKGSEKNRIVHFHEQVQPYYWNTSLHENELIASYFPIAKRAIEASLRDAGLETSEIKWFVPHNVSLRSWEILAKLLEIPMEKIWTKNIARLGHTVSCDHIINLVDMEREGVLEKGDFLLLFTFGFGASWSCLIVEH